MSTVYKAVAQLKPLFEAMAADDQDRVGQTYDRISHFEGEADDMKKELRHHLPKGLFMPVDRRDLLEVLLMQDSIANQAKDIAGLVTGRRMTLPDALKEPFLEYGDGCVAAAAKALDVIMELDELVETGFRGPEVERVEAMLDELDELEGRTDKQQIKLRAILFGLEDALRPTDAMFMYRLIEWTGTVADNAQKVGSRLQLLLAR
jgi:predicted phosphate transport protein (TIGR00153 family)